MSIPPSQSSITSPCQLSRALHSTRASCTSDPAMHIARLRLKRKRPVRHSTSQSVKVRATSLMSCSLWCPSPKGNNSSNSRAKFSLKRFPVVCATTLPGGISRAALCRLGVVHPSGNRCRSALAICLTIQIEEHSLIFGDGMQKVRKSPTA